MDKMDKDSLEYHSKGRPGKISLQTTKPCVTQYDLSLAYSPGVAAPCLEIHKDKEKVWQYTARGNSVAVVTDGSAVLGLGDIGPEAALPVMEGKGVLFKRFADVDAFPICLQDVRNKQGHSDVDKIVETVKRLEPTFGGINLEDIGSPACFEIESRLKKQTKIPIFHDDQHGTAIISLAGLLNGLQLTGKKIENIKIVVNGAGAAGIACAKFYITAGAKRENIVLCDRKGIITQQREQEVDQYKAEFALDTDKITLQEAMKDADVFIGLSVGNVVTKDMVQSMADKPIIYAMANPIPEIMPADAFDAGAFIVGTGRSDFPNQVNNVLGFPGIFRGALDCEATDINEEMKLAASRALAEIAKEPVSAKIRKFLQKAYPEDSKAGMFDGNNPLKPTYVIPKPFDPRVVPRVARYVAESAEKSGIALHPIGNGEEYEKSVAKRIADLKL